MCKLNIANFIHNTEVEGPGCRFALWVQGCIKRCDGCCNKEMQPFRVNKILLVEHIINEIKYAQSKYSIEGITFLGGEPFLQAKGLSLIANYCKTNGLSVVVFTGYTLSELKTNNFIGSNDLLTNCDLLIDGNFNKNQIDYARNWIGSKNQNLHFLSDFYKEGIEYEKKNKSGFEVRLYGSKITISGDPCYL